MRKVGFTASALLLMASSVSAGMRPSHGEQTVSPKPISNHAIVTRMPKDKREVVYEDLAMALWMAQDDVWKHAYARGKTTLLASDIRKLNREQAPQIAKIAAKYRAQVGKKYGLTAAELNAIEAEGRLAGWQQQEGE